MQAGLLHGKVANLAYTRRLFPGYADIVNAAPPHY